MKVNFEMSPEEVAEFFEKRWGKKPKAALGYAYEEISRYLETDPELDELFQQEGLSADKN